MGREERRGSPREEKDQEGDEKERGRGGERDTWIGYLWYYRGHRAFVYWLRVDTRAQIRGLSPSFEFKLQAWASGMAHIRPRVRKGTAILTGLWTGCVQP